MRRAFNMLDSIEMLPQNTTNMSQLDLALETPGSPRENDSKIY